MEFTLASVNWPNIPENQYRILIIGGSELGKKIIF